MSKPRHPARQGVAVVIVLVVLSSGGCPLSSEPQGENASVPVPPASESIDTDTEQVAVRDIDEKELAEVLQRHRGKVILVDFWALWCLPCVKLFPHTVALHDRFADRGLVVISVSLDDPPQRPDVEAFLKEQKATFENFLSRYGTGSRSMEVFEIDGGVPHLKLYGRDGKLERTFQSASIDPEEVDREVAMLLER